jgi:hypothetical protein
MAPSWLVGLSVTALYLQVALATPVFESLHALPEGWTFSRTPHSGKLPELRERLSRLTIHR